MFQLLSALATCSDKRQLLNVEVSNQNAKALKQILPLFAYPIIYFVLFLLAFSDRVYIATQGATAFSFTVALVS